MTLRFLTPNEAASDIEGRSAHAANFDMLASLMRFQGLYMKSALLMIHSAILRSEGWSFMIELGFTKEDAVLFATLLPELTACGWKAKLRVTGERQGMLIVSPNNRGYR